MSHNDVILYIMECCDPGMLLDIIEQAEARGIELEEAEEDWDDESTWSDEDDQVGLEDDPWWDR